MAGMRYQPQGLVRLDRRNSLLRGAQAVVIGSASTNLVSGIPLTVAGTGVAKLATPAGIADSFRKNFYKETELLPAIGTQSFVELWVGYPNASPGAKSGGTETGFLTGSSNNSTGIAGNINTSHVVSEAGSSGSQWGAVYNWATLNSAFDVLVPGVLTCLVVVRRADRMEFWRNGVLVHTVTQSPASYAASKFIVGSFIEDTAYWPSAGDMLQAGRIVAEWTPDQVRSFSANPWQILDAGSSSSTYQAAIASASSGAAPTSATGTLASTLADTVLSSAGGVVNSGSLAATMASASLAAAGSVTTQPSGSIAATLAGATLAAAGVAVNAGSFASALGAATMSAIGTAASNASGIIAAVLAGASLFASGFTGAAPPAITTTSGRSRTRDHCRR